MEDKNQNATTGIGPADAGVPSLSAGAVHEPPPSGLAGLSLDEPQTPLPSPSQGQQPRSQVKLFLRVARRLDVLLAILLIIGLVVFYFVAIRNPKQNAANTSSTSGQFGTIKIPLGDLVSGRDLSLGGSSNVTINGSLQLNNGLLIAPTLQPTGAKAGQIYYDSGTNQLAYFNGETFVFLTAPSLGVVQSLGGATGQLTLGDGFSLTNNQLSNAGVLSVQGETGAVTFTAGPGIVINGTSFSNSGVLSVTAGTPNVTVGNDGAGNVTISVDSPIQGTGTVTSSGSATAGVIPVFTASQNIENSIITQSGLTVTISGDLSVVTGGLSLSNALTVSNGGTGATSLAGNGVLVGNGTAPVSSVAAGSPGLCLLSTAGAPTWAACPSASGVNSLNGLTGALNIANASAAGSTITIDDASTSTKGIASFNGTNFTVLGGVVNTVQNIDTGATPTFVGVNTNSITPSAALTVGIGAQTALLQGSTTTITSNGVGNNIVLNSAGTIELQDNTNVTGNLSASGDVAVNGGDLTSTGALNITPGGTLTVGVASQTLTLQGGGTTSLRATSGGNTTIVGFTSPTANTTLNFPALAAGTYTICTSSGNCSGAAVTLQAAYSNSTNPEIVLDATRGALTIRDSGTPLGANLLEVQDNAGSTTYLAVTSAGAAVTGTITASGNINTTGGALQTNGTTRVDNSGNLINIAAVTASGSATFQGGTVTAGTNAQAGSLVLNDGSSNTGTLQVAALGQNTTYVLPDPGTTTATICLSNGNCAGSGGGVTTSGGTPNAIPKFTGSQTIGDSTITDNGTTVAIGGALSVSNNATFAGDLALNGGDLTSTGALNITPGGALTLGSTSQTALLQGSTTTITSNGAGNDIVFTSADQIRLTGFDCTVFANGGLLTTDASGNLVCADDDGGGSSPTFQTVYNGSNPASFTLNSTNGGLVISDNATPIGASLFKVQNNAGSTAYLDVSSTGASIGGTLNVSGNTTVTGDVAVNGGDLTSTGALNITPGGTLTLGVSGEQLVLQGDASTQLTATDSGNTTSLVFQTPTADVTYRLPTAAVGTYDICTSIGNCAGSGGGVTTTGGTANTIALFTSAQAIGDSIITQSGTTIDIAGSLTLANALGVGSGGTGLNATPTNGQLLIGNGSGYTLGTLTNNGGLTITNGSGTIGIAVNFGAVSGTAVQGDTTLICPAGAGNLTGGGNSITLGSGGSCNNLNTVNNPTFTTSVTTPLVQNAGLTLAATGANNLLLQTNGSTRLTVASGGNLTATGSLTLQGGGLVAGADSQAGSVTLHDGGTGGAAHTGTMQVISSLGQNTTYVLPDPGGASATICLNTGNCAGSGGGITGSGTANQVAKFTSSGVIADSTITDDGTDVSITGDFVIQGGGIALGTTSQLGSLVLHDGNGQTTTFQAGNSSTDLTFVLPVNTGVANQCLKQSGTGNQLVWQDCDGGSGGSSATLQTAYDNSLDPEVVLNSSVGGLSVRDNATPISGNLFEIQNNAGSTNYFSVTTSGAAVAGTFTATGNINTSGGSVLTNGVVRIDNSGNLTNIGTVSAGTYNGQTISSAASFTGTLAVAGNTTLTGDLGVNGGDLTSTGALNITPGGTLTVGVTGQQLILQGNASTQLTATGGGFTTTIGFAGTPTGNLTYNFDRSATGGTYTICTTIGNCAGSGGGVTTPGGTTGTLAKFTGSQTLGDSLLSESGAVVTVNGNLNLTTGNQFTINGTQISSAALSNDSNLAKLSASQTFTGNTVAFQNASNSTNAFNIQNAGGSRILTVDSSNGQVILGVGSALDGKLVFSNVSNSNTVTLVPGTPTANRTLTLPDASGIICTDSGNCAGAGATLQTAYNFSVGGTTPKIKLNDTLLGIDIQDADTTIGANLFNVRASDNAGLGLVMFGVGNTGEITLQNSANSTAAFRLLTQGGTSVLTGDTSNGRIILGQSTTLNGTLVFNNATNTNTVVISSAAVTANRTLTLPDASGIICTDSGNCNGAGGTLQTSYNNSTNPEITLDATRGAVTIRDNATPIGANLLEVQNNAGSTTYLGVSTAGISVTGTVTATGNINTSGGVLQTAGTTRVDNSGNLTNIGNITGTTGNIDFTNFDVIGASGNTTIGGTVDVTGTGTFSGNFIANGNSTIGNAASDTLTIAATLQGGTPLLFEGGTVDANQLSLSIATLTTDRIVTLGDESGTICLQGSANCGFATGTSASYIQNQTASTQTANFKIQSTADGTNTGTIVGRNSQTADLLQFQSSSGGPVAGIRPSGMIWSAPVNDPNTDVPNNARLFVQPLSNGSTAIIARVTAGGAPTGDILQLQSADGTSNYFTVGVSGAVTSKNGTNSANAMRVQDTGSNDILRVDTSAKDVAVGAAAQNATLTVSGDVLWTAGADVETAQGFESTTFVPTSPGTWTTGGNVSWARSTAEFKVGIASAATGTITGNQISWLDMDYTFAQAGTLSFWWKVSSEPGFDFLMFCVDNDANCTLAGGGYTRRTSGTADGWTRISVPVAAGAHSFRWAYAKDAAVDTGSDKGWIDDIHFTAQPTGTNTIRGDYLQLISANTLKLQNSANANALVVDVDGRIGVNTAVTSETLTVEGNIGVQNTTVGSKFRVNTESATAVELQTAGNSIVLSGYTGNVFNQPSSNRYKPFLLGYIGTSGSSFSDSALYIGSGSASTTPMRLVLSHKSTSPDPTAIDGAMYYNEALGKMRCAQAGVWEDCIDNPLIGRVVAQLRRAANQSIPDGTDTAISWDTQDYLPFGGHSLVTNPTRFTPTTAGRYLIMAKAGFDSSSTGNRRGIQIVKNGSTTVDGGYSAVFPASVGVTGVTAIATVVMNGTTDYIIAEARQTNGTPGAVNLTSATDANSTLIVTYVGPD